MATRAEIITKAVTYMDEYTPQNEGLLLSSGNEGTFPIKATAEEVLDDCTLEVLKDRPLHLIPDVCLGDLTTPSGTSVITFAKPSDFIKINYIKLDDWSRAVQKTITPDHPLYQLQGNTYVQGKPSKPVVVETQENIECYTTAVAVGGTYSYVKFVLPESITDDNVINSIAWLVASKTLAIMGEESSKIAYENYVKTIK